VSRIRLISSKPVLEAAERLVKVIVQHYGQPNLTVNQLRDAALSSADPMAVSALRAAASCRRSFNVASPRRPFTIEPESSPP